MIPKLERWNFRRFQNLARILERPWFRRVWVVQEFVLARNDPMIYVGASSIPWQALMKQISDTLDRLFPGVHFDPPGPLQCLLNGRFKKAISGCMQLRRMRLEVK